MINDLTAKELKLINQLFAIEMVSDMQVFELKEFVENVLIDEYNQLTIEQYKDFSNFPAFKRAVEIVKGLRKK